jgi:hypothetical protein
LGRAANSGGEGLWGQTIPVCFARRRAEFALLRGPFPSKIIKNSYFRGGPVSTVAARSYPAPGGLASRERPSRQHSRKGPWSFPALWAPSELVGGGSPGSRRGMFPRGFAAGSPLWAVTVKATGRLRGVFMAVGAASVGVFV